MRSSAGLHRDHPGSHLLHLARPATPRWPCHSQQRTGGLCSWRLSAVPGPRPAGDAAHSVRGLACCGKQGDGLSSVRCTVSQHGSEAPTVSPETCDMVLLFMKQKLEATAYRGGGTMGGQCSLAPYGHRHLRSGRNPGGHLPRVRAPKPNALLKEPVFLKSSVALVAAAVRFSE